MPSRRMQRKLEKRADGSGNERLDSASQSEHSYTRVKKTQQKGKTISNKAIRREQHKIYDMKKRLSAQPVSPEEAILNAPITNENLLEYSQTVGASFNSVREASNAQKYARWANTALVRAETSNGPRKPNPKKNTLRFSIVHTGDSEDDIEQ